MAINLLIDIPVKENETKMIRFANYLRGVFPSATADADTLKLASKALGELPSAWLGFFVVVQCRVACCVLRAVPWKHTLVWGLSGAHGDAALTILGEPLSRAQGTWLALAAP